MSISGLGAYPFQTSWAVAGASLLYPLLDFVNTGWTAVTDLVFGNFFFQLETLQPTTTQSGTVTTPSAILPTTVQNVIARATMESAELANAALSMVTSVQISRNDGVDWETVSVFEWTGGATSPQRGTGNPGLSIPDIASQYSGFPIRVVSVLNSSMLVGFALEHK